MKILRLALLASLFSIFFVESFSQVTSVPEQAKANFAKQYPDAQNVKWDNDVVNVNARFEQNGEQKNAEYNNKGIWKHTFTESSYDKLPAAVTEGFKKSKFADREVTQVENIDLPGNVKQYRLRVEKNDLQKKYLYFNTDGRLVRDANTL